MANANETKTAESITWHNAVQVILVHPTPEAPEEFTSVEVTLMVGRTIADGETVKRAAWRVKAIVGTAEFGPFPNAVKAVNEAIRAKFGGTKFHDVSEALKAFSFPDMDDKAEKADDSDWTKFANAETLYTARNAAAKAAGVFKRGESDMRSGLLDMSDAIAQVADSLESPKAFKAWLDSAKTDGVEGAADLLEQFSRNKNAKSELIFVGKLPREYVNSLPETSVSAKAIQLQFNNAKNKLAEEIAAMAWKGKKKLPTAAHCQTVLLEALGDARGFGENGALVDNPTNSQILARTFYSAMVNAIGEDGNIALFAHDDGKLAMAKDGEGVYAWPIQFGSGKRASEIGLAFCQAVNALKPEVREAKADEAADKAAGEAMRPRVFADYGVTEAAMHLARILSARPDWSEVLDALNGMADRAEADTWPQVLRDVQSGIDAEKAEAEKAAAEQAADDDA